MKRLQSVATVHAAFYWKTSVKLLVVESRTTYSHVICERRKNIRNWNSAWISNCATNGISKIEKVKTEIFLTLKKMLWNNNVTYKEIYYIMIYQMLSEVNIHKAIIKYNGKWHKIRMSQLHSLVACLHHSQINICYSLRWIQ